MQTGVWCRRGCRKGCGAEGGAEEVWCRRGCRRGCGADGGAVQKGVQKGVRCRRSMPSFVPQAKCLLLRKAVPDSSQPNWVPL